MGNKSPRNWRYVPIKELYRGLYDGPHATPAPSNSGPIFLGIKNIAEDGSIDLSDIRHIAEEDFPKWTKRVTPQSGDIVFSYEATLHRYALIPPGFRGCLGRRMALIRVNPDRCDYKFLYFYLRSAMWRQVIESKQVIGATVDRVPLIKFPDFPVLAPEVGTQKQIASILSAYDDLIENNKRRIAILEKMAEEIYREWFVRMRFPASAKATAGKPPRRTNKGLPVGWIESRLGDEVTFTMGQSPKSEHYNTIGDGLPFNQGVGTYGERFPKREIYCSSTGRKAKTGDILFSVRAPVGRLNIADCEMIIGRGLAAIRHKKNFNSYLYYLLKVAFASEDIIGNGSIFNSVGKDELARFPILQPPEALVAQYDELASNIDREIELLIRATDNLTQTRDLLLPRLISGKLSVENLELPSNERLAPVSSALSQQELAHA